MNIHEDYASVNPKCMKL